MELRRFFIPKEDLNGSEAIIKGEEFFHLKVLRFKKGFNLILCTGDNYDYYGEVSSIGEDYAEITITDKKHNNSAAAVDVRLYAAVIKEDNFELTVQKAVELGASGITPVISRNVSEKNPRPERLNKIAVEAAKQCGRAVRPEILPVLQLKDAIADAKARGGLIIAACEEERGLTFKGVLAELKDMTGKVSVFVGPEGGFTEEERALFDGAVIRRFTLGRRILRAETASIAALAIIMYELDK